MKRLHPPTSKQKHRLGLFLTVATLGVMLLFMMHYNFTDAQGNLLIPDFMNSWSASLSLAAGVEPAKLYDWDTHNILQRHHAGFDFEGEYGWQYPPFVFWMVMPLGLLPFGVAWLMWDIITGIGFLKVMRGIAGHWAIIPLACLFPAVWWNAVAGQNGFLTAMLIGGCVVLLERAPLRAGVLLGLLSFKPHLGIIFPIVLLIERRWKVFISATMVVLLLVGLSMVTFGLASWQAFFAALPVVTQKILINGGAGYENLNSIYGWAMLAGWDAWAIPLQLGGMLLTVAGVYYIRTHARQRELRQAALALAPLFMTPYIWIYDAVLLMVPIAFFLRLCWRQGFLPMEQVLLVLIAFFTLVHPLWQLPWANLGAILMAGLIWRRMRYDSNEAASA